jgi:serine/threonine-protein kinase
MLKQGDKMEVGSRVGDYEVLAKLGAGGMGEVFKVRHVVSGRIEAMKRLPPSKLNTPGLLDRFRREIKVQAALDHPNIARLFTAHIAGDNVLMFMEYIEGDSLEVLLARGPMPASEAVEYGIQMLDALEYAHEHGVVHRDLKPANIMRTSAGTIKLMDFGICHADDEQHLTQTGFAIGTIRYMSPEQFDGRPADRRSDLYSFGVCLYEMIAGRPLFEGASDLELMLAHLNKTPDALTGIVPGLDGRLNEAVLKALAKEPAERFPSAAKFRGALEALASAPTETLPCVAAVFPAGAPTGPAATPNRRGLYMAAGSVATLLVLASAVAFFPLSTPPPAAAGPPAVGRGLPPGSLPGGRWPGAGLLAPAVGGSPIPPAPAARRQARALAQAPPRPTSAPRPAPAPVLAPPVPPPFAPAASVVSVLVVPGPLRARSLDLRAKADAYAASLRPVSDQLRQGDTGLRPDVAAALHRAEAQLGAAESDMNQGLFAQAEQSLNTAETALKELDAVYGR